MRGVQEKMKTNSGQFLATVQLLVNDWHEKIANESAAD